MKYEQWNIPTLPEKSIEALMDAGYPYLVSSVLVSRGVETAEQAALALERERTLSHSPFLMRDMDKAVARIQTALADGEKLAVFGDYDVDGITATCLLTDYLRSRGAEVIMHIPGRFDEGYGLSNEAIGALAAQGVGLIITVDCGITGVEETDYANSLGVDVVITDHHECKEVLPAAVAVVDPHRPDCGYPFKHLAGVGVALKLVLALGGNDREDALFARYCTLAAIGTIADVMRMEGENRAIVSTGLEAIGHSDFIGLHALLREAGLAGKPISSIQIGFVLSPRINAAGRMGRAALAAELLLTNDPAEAEEKAKGLHLDMSRGKPSPDQLDLSNEILTNVSPETGYTTQTGWDARNYGVLDGINECKSLFADLLEVPMDNVIVGGGSSLNLMFDYVTQCMMPHEKGKGWLWSGKPIKFLCPCPGYDRHFSILEYYNVEMINITMEDDGPNIAEIEEAIKDEQVKGMFCVPKYSNPTGCTYSDELYFRLWRSIKDGIDGLVIGSPVFYGGPNGALCALLDRLFYSMRHTLAYKPGASVIVCRREGASSAFDRLNKYFTMNNMPLVPSQNWNTVYGSAAGQAALDEEGMQTMRTLGQNMAWMLRRLAVEEQGHPTPERPVWTDFIR